MAGEKYFYNSPTRYYWNDDTGNIGLADEQFFFTSSPLQVTIYAAGVEKFNSTSLQSIVLFNISGSGLESYNNTTYVGSGSLFVSSTGIEARKYDYTTLVDTVLFGTSGSAVEKFLPNPPEETQNITLENQNVSEKFTFDYNEDTIVRLELEDFGSVLVSVTNKFDDTTLTFDSTLVAIAPYFAGAGDNYGLISDLVTDGYLDYGSTEFNADAKSASGSLTISGFAGDLTGQLGGNSTYNYVGIGALFTTDSLVESRSYDFVSDETSKLEISGTLVERETNDYVADGSLFSFGEKIESATYDYNESSILPYDQEDYQNISVPATLFDNYGQVLDFATQGQEDFNLIVLDQTTTPFGSLLLSGESLNDLDAYFIDFVPSGLITLSSSAVEKFVANDFEGTQIISISSEATYSQKYDYVTEGSLFSFGDRIESRTYDYNEESVSPYVIDDYQNISSTATGFGNYGSITDFTTQGQEDYDLIVETSDAVPFGSILISGQSIDEEDNRFIDFVPSGTITVSSSAIEKFVANDFEETQLISIQGSTTYSETDVYIAGGSLFSFGEKIESRTYDYNEDSVSPYVIDDYQNISSPASLFDNYGQITEITTAGQEDYDLIVETSDAVPFGSIIISGQSVDEEDNRFIDFITSGTITISSSAIEKFVANDFEETQLITVQGSTTYSETDVYIAGGSLFSFGDRIESRTYDYNQESVSLYVIEDSGSIADPVTSLQDNGLITEVLTQGESDNGFVVLEETTLPYGTITISGSGSGIAEFNIYGVEEISSGLATISGTAVEKYVTSYDLVPELVNIAGSATYSETEDYIAGGSLFSFGEKIESRTYDYNEDSIEVFNTLDYGNVASTATDFDDYGSVGQLGFGDGQLDFGDVISQTEVRPYGSLQFSGESTFSATTREIFTGLFNILSSSTYKQTSVPANLSGLFEFGGRGLTGYFEQGVPTYTGSYGIGFELDIFSSESFSKGLYTGSGSLFSIGNITERVTYSYNRSSVSTYVIDDFGNLGTVTNSLDYGSIIGLTTQGQDDFGIVVLGETSNAFGSITLSSQAVTRRIINDAVGGPLFAISGAAESVGFNPPENTFLYQIGGDYSDLKATYSEVVSGNIFSFGEKIESVTYDYNDDAVTQFASEDNGSIVDPVTATADYGSIVDFATQGQEDLGSLVFDQTNVPFGSINISGASVDVEINGFIDFVPSGLITLSDKLIERRTYYPEVIHKRPVVSFDSTSETFDSIEIDNSTLDLNESSYLESTVLTGTKSESFSKGLYTGQGSLFSFAEKIESRTYDYNDDAVKAFTSDDNGSIIDPVTTTVDYGSIVDFATQGQEDLGIIVLDQTTTPFGSINISGASVDTEFNAFIDFVPSGTILVSVDHIESRTYDWFPDALVSTTKLSGTSEESFSKGLYTGEGSLFSFGEKIESVTYDYNDDSVTQFASDDNGSIIDPVTTTADYGSIVDFTTQGQEDLGSLVFDQTIVPYGQITLSGASVDAEFNAFIDFVPSGTILVSVDHVERRTYDWFPDALADTTQLSGAAEESFTPATEIGSGILFTFGEKVESRSYDYNNESIDAFDSVDNGSVTDPVTSTADYGSIVDFTTQGQEDSGLIVLEQTTTPFGTITISGGISDIQFAKGDAIGSGTITISGELVHPDIDFTPAVTAVGDISISGSTEESYTPATEIGSGTLFSFGQNIESRTYDYNDESIDAFDSVDNGSIIDPVTSTADYGSIVDFATQGQEDNGLVVLEQTTTPFGTITISGGFSDIEFAKGNYTASGTITISGELVHPDIDFTPAPDGFGDITVTGSADESFSITTYIGSGTLFSFGEKIESRTYDYNDESVLPLLPPDDSGSIVDPVTSVVDYGGILDLLTQGEQDYGLIASEQTILPFGTITISGGVSDIKIGEGNYDGSGTITISGELVFPDIDFTPAPDGSGTINILGNVDESYARTSYIASGTLFSFGEKIESRTYDYNEDSILYYTEPDYGSITDIPTQLDDDYETITIAANRSDDYGVLVGFGATTEVPFGGITISGELVYPYIDYTPSPDGTGLFVVGGSADEAFDFIFGRGRRRGGNIRLDGLGTEATYSEIDSYVGVGTLFKFGIAPESYTVVPEVVGIHVISGTALEAFSAQTPEDTQLFVIDGTADESRQREYTGFGTLPSLYGELFHPDIDYTPHYGIEKNIGIGTTGIQISGQSETVRARAKSGTGLFNIVNGFSPQVVYPYAPLGIGKSWSFTPATEIGSGVIEIDITSRNYSPIYPLNSGDPGAGTGLIRINDDAGLTITRATLPYFAKGGFIATGTGAESFSYTNYDGSGISTISGVAQTREINVYGYYGDDKDPGTSGLITISTEKQGIVEKNTESYVGSGGFSFSDKSITKEIDAYEGSGQISLTNIDVSEAFVANPEEDTILFNISGSGFESIIYQPTEDTVLYNIIGAASDEKITKDYVGIADTTTVLISGASISRIVPSIPGTGLFRFIRYASDDTNLTCDSEDITSDYTDNAEESITWNTPEETVIVGISGISTYAEYNIYTYQGNIDISITEDKSEKYGKDYVGFGSLFNYGTTETESISYEYSGNGNLFTGSQSSSEILYIAEENTLIINISGSADTSTQNTYEYVGSTDIQLSQSSTTSTNAVFEYGGFASYVLSGETLYPDIIFIPSWIGSGSISIFGSVESKQIYGSYVGIGSLFTVSGAKESFTESTYESSGTINFSATSSDYANNPYQIPRTYVCII